MRRTPARTIEDRLAKLEELVALVDRRFERIELVTTVREPVTGVSADAYNGLRKQVIAAVGERTAHLQQLAQFDAALRAQATPDQLARMVEEWLAAAGLRVVDDAAVEEAFEVVGPPEGTRLRVLKPAYVDEHTGRVIRGGVAERHDAEPDPVAVGAEEDVA